MGTQGSKGDGKKSDFLVVLDVLRCLGDLHLIGWLHGLGICGFVGGLLRTEMIIVLSRDAPNSDSRAPLVFDRFDESHSSLHPVKWRWLKKGVHKPPYR